MRVGPVEDDAPDYELPVWAGIVPLQLTAGAPERDERCPADIRLPSYAGDFFARRR
jgi:hypothetical protein